MTQFQHPRLNFPLDAIEWKEGMLLAPQHFQQESLRTSMLAAWHAQVASPFHFGVTAIDIDEHRLGSGIFRVASAEGVMPDGLPFRHDPSQGELVFDLKPHANKLTNSPAFVFLSVLRFVDGRPISGTAGTRYALYEAANVRDLSSAGVDLSLGRLRPALALHLGEAPESYVSIPIARVEVRNEAYTLTEYLPPMLRVPDTSPVLRLTKELCATLRRKAQVLDDRQQQLQLTDDPEGAAKLCRQIEVLVTPLPPIEAVASAKAVQPFTLYVALTGLVGPLAALVPGQVPPELPAYNHWDPRGSFGEVFDALRRLLEKGTKENFSGFRFKPEPNAFSLAFRQEWFDSPLVLSVQRRRGVTDEALAEWMKSSVIASRSRVEELRTRRIPGLGREWVDRFEELIPTRDTLLFQVTPDRNFLRDGEDLVIFNREDGDGSPRPSEILLYVRRAQQ
ncbi:MAG: type VI secretion system baseplate subunit TssK [Myxococcales bacterium]|nr:type VI secretion system baseplate subunit TssK [Myxococcales bacterium]